MNQAIEQLIHQALHGELSDEDRQRLSAWICASKDNARAYYRVLIDEQAIRKTLGQATQQNPWLMINPEDSSVSEALAILYRQHLDGLDTPIELTPEELEQRKHAITTQRRVAFKARLILGGGLAAAIALAGLAVLIVGLFTGPEQQVAEQPTDERVIVATLTATHNAAWGGPASAGLAIGDKLHASQRLTLTAGFAQITTARGAVAIIEAPATIELLNNDNAIRLHSGKLVGICETDSSKGFLVRTPHLDITDLGTEFGVQVAGNQLTATVITGEVQILTPGGEPQTINANQTARLTVQGNKQDLVINDQLAQGFEQLLPRVALVEQLRNDPAMIAYYGFEAEDIVDGKLLNRAAATQGKMDGTLGQSGRMNSEPTLTVGRLAGTHALRFEANEFDVVRVPASDASALNGLEQFTIGVWVKPDHKDQISHHLVTKRGTDAAEGSTLNFGLAWNRREDDPAYARNSVFMHSGVQAIEEAGLSSGIDSLPRGSAWTHIVVTYDRGERWVYIDGEQVSRLPRVDSGRSLSLDAELWIGGALPHRNANNTYLDGDLDELFILGRAMPADEITALYETGVAQP